MGCYFSSLSLSSSLQPFTSRFPHLDVMIEDLNMNPTVAPPIPLPGQNVFRSSDNSYRCLECGCRPRRDLRQDQDVAPGDDEGALGVHQEEQAQQGPHHRAGREAEEGPAGQLVEHVQDAGHAEEAHQVSARSRARSIAKPCPTLEQHMSRTTAAW